MSQFLASGGQSIGVSASASVLPMNVQDLYPLGWTLKWTGIGEFNSDPIISTTVGRNPLEGME